jgi:hypothetical protein
MNADKITTWNFIYFLVRVSEIRSRAKVEGPHAARRYHFAYLP